MTTRRGSWFALLVIAGCMASSAAVAGPLDPGNAFGAPGYTPRVPVSALARPFSWIDPSRFHVSTSLSVGSGGGRGSDALQLTSFSYQFRAPVTLSMSLGNSFGMSGAGNGQKRGSAFFLEGLDLAYRPHANMMFQIHYRDVRSPLQLSPDLGYGLRGF